MECGQSILGPHVRNAHTNTRLNSSECSEGPIENFALPPTCQCELVSMHLIVSQSN